MYCFVQSGLHLLRRYRWVQQYRRLVDPLPACRPGVDPPLQRVQRREVVLCPSPPVVDSESGDVLVEGLWSPVIADRWGALPFRWQLGRALDVSSRLRVRRSPRLRSDGSDNSGLCNRCIHGPPSCMSSWRCVRRSTCPTRCNRSNGQVWQGAPSVFVDCGGGGLRWRRPRREYESSCCYCYFLGEGWLAPQPDLDYVVIPP